MREDRLSESGHFQVEHEGGSFESTCSRAMTLSVRADRLKAAARERFPLDFRISVRAAISAHNDQCCSVPGGCSFRRIWDLGRALSGARQGTTLAGLSSEGLWQSKKSGMLTHPSQLLQMTEVVGGE